MMAKEKHTELKQLNETLQTFLDENRHLDSDIPAWPKLIEERINKLDTTLTAYQSTGGLKSLIDALSPQFVAEGSKKPTRKEIRVKTATLKQEVVMLVASLTSQLELAKLKRDRIARILNSGKNKGRELKATAAAVKKAAAEAASQTLKAQDELLGYLEKSSADKAVLLSNYEKSAPYNSEHLSVTDRDKLKSKDDQIAAIALEVATNARNDLIKTIQRPATSEKDKAAAIKSYTENKNKAPYVFPKIISEEKYKDVLLPLDIQIKDLINKPIIAQRNQQMAKTVMPALKAMKTQLDHLEKRLKTAGTSLLSASTTVQDGKPEAYLELSAAHTAAASVYEKYKDLITKYINNEIDINSMKNKAEAILFKTKESRVLSTYRVEPNTRSWSEWAHEICNTTYKIFGSTSKDQFFRPASIKRADALDAAVKNIKDDPKPKI